MIVIIRNSVKERTQISLKGLYFVELLSVFYAICKKLRESMLSLISIHLEHGNAMSKIWNF